MKILIADELPQDKIEVLREKGYECIVEPDLKAEQIPERISGIEILVVRSTKVLSEVFDKSDSLGLVVRSGAGINTIDCQGAADSGIYVCNVPGTNSIAVAELTMGLILAIDRHIPSATSDLKENRWNKKIYSDAEGLFGKTLGIVGLGEIGLAVAERARSFGITVLAKKASRKPETESKIRSNGIKLVDTIEELISESDMISIHLPSKSETKNLSGISSVLSEKIIETDKSKTSAELKSKSFNIQKFNKVKSGQYIILKDVGAYGSTMSSNYNARPLIEELMVDGSQIRIIRKTQSYEDFIKNEI